MSSVKTPQQKKKLALERDHVTLPQAGNKTFRVAWRKKKKNAVHKVRRKQKVEVQKATADPSGADDIVRSATKRSVKKWTVVTLGEKLRIQAAPVNDGRFGLYHYSNGKFKK
jgi:hypothetical protein